MFVFVGGLDGVDLRGLDRTRLTGGKRDLLGNNVSLPAIYVITYKYGCTKRGRSTGSSFCKKSDGTIDNSTGKPICGSG